jgi:ABC-2 type transport system ATP-binding protein
MKQTAQFVAGTMHDPDLIIIDEPFSGLDPVNTRIIKSLLFRMRDRGAGIIMSTHQMHQVEEMCGRILLINEGKRILYGSLEEIRRQYASNAIEVDLEGELNSLPGVRQITPRNGGYRMVLDEGSEPEDILASLVNNPAVKVQRFERVQVSLDEIFVQAVRN